MQREAHCGRFFWRYVGSASRVAAQWLRAANTAGCQQRQAPQMGTFHTEALRAAVSILQK